MPTCWVFDTSNPVPRSEGKVDPRAALKRLARKLNVEIKFDIPPRSGKMQQAYDPGSPYLTSSRGRKIREAVLWKKDPEQIYTGGRKVRWSREDRPVAHGEFKTSGYTAKVPLDPVEGRVTGKPAIRYKALRPVGTGKTKPYATPAGMAWTTVSETHLKPGETFHEVPAYERRRFDWKRYLRAQAAGESKQMRAQGVSSEQIGEAQKRRVGELWRGHLQETRELYPGEKVGARQLKEKTILRIESQMREHRKAMAGGLRTSLDLIRAKNASLESARAHPERMVEYKKRFWDLVGKQQEASKSARQGAVERLNRIAARGTNVLAAEKETGWQATRAALTAELEGAKTPEAENEARKKLAEHFSLRRTPEELKSQARGTVGLLKEVPESHGGTPLKAKENIETIQDVLQKGSKIGKPITEGRVLKLKRKLDEIYERGTLSGLEGTRKKVLASGKVFRAPIKEVAQAGYPYLSKLGLGLGAAGLAIGGGLAIHAARKYSRKHELLSRHRLIHFDEEPYRGGLSPEERRKLDKYALEHWHEEQRVEAAAPTEEPNILKKKVIQMPKTAPQKRKVAQRQRHAQKITEIPRKASADLETRRAMQSGLKKWDLWHSVLGGKENRVSYKRMFREQREKAKILGEQLRTHEHLSGEALKHQAETLGAEHATKLRETFSQAHRLGREEATTLAKGAWEKKAGELTQGLLKQGAKRAGRLKWIAAGALAGGALGGYALGRHDKGAYQRHEARQILDMYKPRQPRQPAQQRQPTITIGISGINGNRRKNVEFQSDDKDQYQDPEWLQKWAHQKLYHRDYSTLGQAQRVKKYTGRTHRLIRDLNIKRQGLPNVDVRGRPRKNEWEKPWVTAAITTGALATGIFGAKKSIKFLREAHPESRVGQIMEGFRRGHIPGREVKGLQKIGQTFHGVGEELKRWRDRPLKEPLKYEHSKFDVVTGKMKSPTQIAKETAEAKEKELFEKIAKGRVTKEEFKSQLREIRFQRRQEDEPPAWHDIATGSIEGGLGFLGTDKLLKKLSKRYTIMERTVPRFATAVGVGGIATGTIGYGLNRLIRQKVAAKRAAKQQQLSARLRLIKFQDPYYDEMNLPKTKSQRTLVARDRYMKQIHEKDIARADRLYKHTALIGAGIGALAARKPARLLRSAGIGAAIGVGTQKAARIYGESTRDPFGERTVRAKRAEEAPEVVGTAALAGYGLHRLRKYLSARNRIIRFQEKPEKHHRLLAGALVAASGIPLYKGAGKFTRIGLRSHIDKLAGKSTNYGKVVADYLEASQHILNQGITGKLAGVALRNPKSAPVKWLIGKGPAELGSARSGINKISREHFSSFRASPTEALDAWAQEVHGQLRPGIQRETHQKQYFQLTKHLNDLHTKGYNDREALRHAANDPQHNQIFKRLAAFKAAPIKNYQKISAGLASVPAKAGLAIAATTKKDGNHASVRS